MTTPPKRAGLDLEPLDRLGVKEHVASQLRRLIEDGALDAGEQLPSERELSERLAVSRSTVREAVQFLGALGLVEIRHGAGTFVRGEVDREQLPSEWLSWTARHEGQVHELLEVRRGLESLAAELAAERGTKRDRAALAKALAAMERALGGPDVPALVEADLAFHTALSAASHNKALGELADSLGRELLRERGAIWNQPGRPQRSLDEHREIYEAVKGGDALRARAALIAHLDSVEHDVDALLADPDGHRPDHHEKRG